MSDTEKNKYPVCAAGTWGWGKGVTGGKMIFGKSEDTLTLRQTFKTACDNGFTMWDTAEIYGLGSAEKILSACMAERKRQVGGDIILSTKHFPGRIYSKGSASVALEKSLRRLHMDCTDIYWLHLPLNIAENMKEFAALMRRGRMKTPGVSNHSLDQIKLADEVLRSYGYRLGAVQNHLSLIRCDDEQKRILEWCKENGVPYFSYMVLEQGALDGKHDSEHRFPALSRRGIAYNNKFGQLAPLIEQLRILGEKYRVSPAQICISWAVSKGTIPIIGLTKPRYVEDMVKGAALRLTAEDTARIESIAEGCGMISRGFWEIL